MSKKKERKMSSSTHQKINAFRYQALMQKHSNENVGKWFKIWCTLASSKTKWEFSSELDEWSRIIGSSEGEARQFLIYMKDKMEDMVIVSGLHPKTKKAMFTVIDQYNKDAEEKEVPEIEEKEIILESLRPVKKTNTTIGKKRTSARRKMRQEIRENYHPAKNSSGISRFTTMHGAYLRVVSKKGENEEEKLNLEYKVHELILEYLDWYKKTPNGEDPSGQYTKTLANFMTDKPWLNDINFFNYKNTGKITTELDEIMEAVNPSNKKKTAEDEIKELMENKKNGN
jgi:hypothetical protein